MLFLIFQESLEKKTLKKNLQETLIQNTQETLERLNDNIDELSKTKITLNNLLSKK